MTPTSTQNAIILVFPPCGTDPAQRDDLLASFRERRGRWGLNVLAEFVIFDCPPPRPEADRAEMRRLAALLGSTIVDVVLLARWPTVPANARLLARALRPSVAAGALVLSRDEIRSLVLKLVEAESSGADPPLSRRSAMLGALRREREEFAGEEAPEERRELGTSAKLPARARPVASPKGVESELAGLLDEESRGALDAVAPARAPMYGYPPGPPGVPLRDRDGPLPHDGLFVRRNNAFGTRATLGIADLIDQGVLIEQTQIRFDDFVATGAGAIPLPGPGQAVAVSHGTAAVPAAFRVHEQTTHLLEIALRAAPAAPTDRPRAAPMAVNVVFVVDVSASMRGEKLDGAKTAIRELFDQLRDVDVLAVVAFSDRVRTILPGTPKARIDPDELTRAVGGLTAAGGTDLNLGLNFGLDEIDRYGRGDLVNALYLFSDGDPTSGETNWITIRTNVARRIRGDVTMSCFGFGSDARMRELDALAGLTGGHSTFVADIDDVRLPLAEDLDRRDHLAAMNIQLRIDIPPEVTIWHLYGHDLVVDPAARAAVRRDADAVQRGVRDRYGAASPPNLIDERGGIRIFAPDLAYGETYWIVFELQAPADAAAPSFGTATVRFFDTLARDNRAVEMALAPAGGIAADAVLTHGISLWTSEITFYALDDLYQNDRATAQRRLSDHIDVLRAAEAFMAVDQFQGDRVTLAKLISLAGNLGTLHRWSDDGGQLTYATYTLSAFGQARSGYRTVRQLGTR